jgi:hypothetical protein
MDAWLIRFRGSLVMGVTWGIAGALVGILIDVFVDPSGAILDMWPVVLGLAGLACGTCFSGIVATAASQRRFDDLSFRRIAVWGAVGGLFAALVPIVVLGGGSARLVYPGENVWITMTLMGLSVSVTAAALAVGVLALARMGQARTRSPSIGAVDEVGVPTEERRGQKGI